MSIFTDPNTQTIRVLQEGQVNLGVWAVQVLLNRVYDGKMTPLVTDGAFGPGTKTAVMRYQADVSIASDGVVGQQTQQRMVRSVLVRVPNGSSVHKGVIEGQINLESGGYLAAANSTVAGGIDLGLVQKRVYGPPFDTYKVKEAMDPFVSVSSSVNELLAWSNFYSSPHANCPFNRWELAVLHHNWPFAADQYYRYGALPNPDRTATWAPASLQPITWDEWAHYYVDQVTKDVVW